MMMMIVGLNDMEIWSVYTYILSISACQPSVAFTLLRHPSHSESSQTQGRSERERYWCLCQFSGASLAVMNGGPHCEDFRTKWNTAFWLAITILSRNIAPEEKWQFSLGNMDGSTNHFPAVPTEDQALTVTKTTHWNHLGRGIDSKAMNKKEWSCFPLDG